MARASAAAENAMLNGLAGVGSTNVIPYVSLHTGDPGTTGASENPGTGSYARQACSWNAASGGTVTNATALTFNTAGTTAVTYIGAWSASSGGNFAIGAALTTSVTGTAITFAANSITLSLT